MTSPDEQPRLVANLEEEASKEEAARNKAGSAPACSRCGNATTFVEGLSTHDLYAEKFVCGTCGAESYRSFGRGSVS